MFPFANLKTSSAWPCAAALLLCAAGAPARAAQSPDDELVSILSELVAYPTTENSGQTVPAAQTLRRRLLEAGFAESDITILGPSPDLGNLVARYPGSDPDLPPALLMGHIDVVDAVASEWSVPGYALTDQDGYLYGRGSMDNKGGVALLVANLVRLQREGFVPRRDLILMATADEETTQDSVQWLLREHRALVDAGFALNADGGMVVEKNEAPVAFLIQAAEKVYLNYRLTASGEGGHSSLPTPDNAIYKLARALTRIEAHQFPENLNEVTRGYLEQFPDSGAIYGNAQRRTTCVATRLEAGHADNALPLNATANINCRMLPQEDIAALEATLRRLAGEGVEMRATWKPVPSPASPMDNEAVPLIRAAAARVFPGLPVAPAMSTGASDGAFTRNAGIPTYGISAMPLDPEDDRNHGIDERVRKAGYFLAREFWYLLLKSL